MAKHNEVGQAGEDLAAVHFATQGYTILQRNYRYGRAEIDIIMQKGDELIFVEVKTRSDTYFSAPEYAVSSKKQKMMLEAAGQFMFETNYEELFRFDVVAIVLAGGVNLKDFEHFENAFFPSW
jgi:putative endonuclease